ADEGLQAAGAPAAHRDRTIEDQPHRPFAEAGAGPLAVLRAGDVDHPEVAARGAGRELPQRTGREQPAVAVTAAGVHHFDLDVALQAVVLQPVVAQDDVAAR